MKKLTKLIINGALFFEIQNTAIAESGVTAEKFNSDEIRLLKITILDLEDRISRLERHAKLTNALEVQTEKIDPKSGWKYRKFWLQLKEGMTATQVESILGHPTRVDDMGGGFKKFFYWGELPTGAISGYVEIYENSVYKVHIPEFRE